MTEHCPTSDYACVLTLTARIGALLDQAAGFLALVNSGATNASIGHVTRHYDKLMTLLEEAVSEYMADHGTPPAEYDMEAMRWVLKGLRP